MSVLFHRTVIAHRGASAYAPENTMTALLKAVELGASWLEFDVRFAKCGTPLLFHDKKLARLTGAKGALSDFNYSYLSRLEVGPHFSQNDAKDAIPTLAMVLQRLASLPVSINIELKPETHDSKLLIKNIIATLSTHDFSLGNQILLSSSDLTMLELLRHYSSDLPLAYVTRRWQKNIIPHINELNFSAYCIHKNNINEQRIALLHENNLKVLVYTVNEASLAERLFDSGVDAVF